MALPILVALVPPARAAVDSQWAGGAEFAVVNTRFQPATSGFSYGLQGSVLKKVASHWWTGVDIGLYNHGSSGVGYADEAGIERLPDGEFTSVRLALTALVRPARGFGPYAVGGIGLYRMTATSSWQGAVHENALGFEIGAGVRGGDQLLPWLEWRWHRGFSRMAILVGAPVDYHTWGIGLGWN